MRSRNTWLVVIIMLVAFSLWVDLVNRITLTNPFTDKPLVDRNTELRRGLDTLGGLQTLLQADVANCASVSQSDLQVTGQILESRANALGVGEIVMQVAGNCRIVAEFPGVSNPEEVVAALQQTALLEFVDMGASPLPDGTTIQTDYGQASAAEVPAVTATAPATSTPAVTPTTEAGATPGATPATTATPPATVYHTVMTGKDLDTVSVQAGTTSGSYQIAFTLKSSGTKTFADYTSSHVGQYLAIVLDKKILSAPVIKNAITDGQGSSRRLHRGFRERPRRPASLRFAAGAGQGRREPDGRAHARRYSVRKSLLAGLIGLSVVVVFMGLYYRVPGILADLALITYSLITLMLYKMIPITLTLPGIAGFILSIGGGGRRHPYLRAT